jgi:hypothetical protein
MEKSIVDNAFKVSADPTSGRMRISLVKNGRDLASIQIDTVEASRIAAILLGNARDAFDQSGKPRPGKDNLTVAATSPSGFGIGPGRKSTSGMLLFYFGDSILGVELENSELRSLGQRLMTAGAEGTAQ